ncbi:efflux RND transporter periplasmic adaptor subunit [Psychromonas sp. KJ10-10]|uniref:efflux RND transporter periplasmic adaptor subunit n=1 Tax=Psychromonas sp. KJ10-10 TaxID=3391823 RepID=UPI0039B3C16D
MKYKISKLALLPLLVLLLSSCQETDQKIVKPELIFSGFTVQNSVENQYRNFKGAVIPADLTPLAFRIEGELTEVVVSAGQKVKKGQLLAQLDDSRLQQQLIDAKAQYELAVKQQQRGQTLSAQNMISGSELDELTANRRIAEVRHKSSANQLNYSKLYAPFDGYISDIPKKNHESVNPGETIVSIYRDDIVQIRIGVSDVVLAMINPTAKTKQYDIRTTFAGESRSFMINYQEHTSEPIEGGNAFEIILEMPQVTPAILPGSTANLDVDMAQAGLTPVTGYQIPMTAIDAGDKHGEFFIWKYIEGKAYKQAVEITEINQDGAVIIKGLTKGDTIIKSNLKKLRHEAPVTIAVEDNQL